MAEGNIKREIKRNKKEKGITNSKESQILKMEKDSD